MNERDEITEFFGEIISVYTSEQAEADEILVKTDNKIINYVTHTVFDRCIEPFTNVWEQFAKTKEEYTKKLLDKLVESAIIEVRKQRKQDWMYSIDCRGLKLWVCQNETGGYTLLFPEDY